LQNPPPHDRQFIEELLNLWRECIDHVRRGASSTDWERVYARIAELQARLDGPHPDSETATADDPSGG
jgi:hypothetical protein